MVLAAAAPILAMAVALSLYAMRDAVVFFYGPSEARAQHVPAGRMVRIGGLVRPGSVQRRPDGALLFDIADHASKVTAVYHGEPPDLFREGQGVVAQGTFDGAGAFQASQVLAKHDERYMPKEVVQALKKSGEWRPDGQAAAAKTIRRRRALGDLGSRDIYEPAREWSRGAAFRGGT